MLYAKLLVSYAQLLSLVSLVSLAEHTFREASILCAAIISCWAYKRKDNNCFPFEEKIPVSYAFKIEDFNGKEGTLKASHTKEKIITVFPSKKRYQYPMRSLYPLLSILLFSLRRKDTSILCEAKLRILLAKPSFPLKSSCFFFF